MSITFTDQFCGAGGSTTGATLAGLEPVLAMNHWRLAIDTHGTNYPQVDHACVDVASTDPRAFPRTDVLLTSPECRAHSYARGRPKDDPTLFNPDQGAERSRATMWDVPRFAEVHEYDAIVVENVVQAVEWGPKTNKGSQFQAWMQAMHGLGYRHRIVSFNSMFAPPTPQSRDRMYVVFWRAGLRAPDLDFPVDAWCGDCERVVAGRQRWKERNGYRRYAGDDVGRYGAQYVYACDCGAQALPIVAPAASAIDWTLPIQRIGDRAKPLAENTIARIQRGLDKIAGREAMVVQVGGNTFERPGYVRAWPTTDPLNTVNCTSDRALVMSNMTHNVPAVADAEPMGTVTTGNKLALIVIPGRYAIPVTSTPPAAVVPLRGHNVPRRPDEGPVDTVCASGNHHGLIVANYTPGWVRDAHHGPVGSVTAHDGHALVVPYRKRSDARPAAWPLPTVTTVDPAAIATVMPDIADCGFRMLQPAELARAQQLHTRADGDPYVFHGKKRDQVRMIGNAVSPPAMTRIAAAVAASLEAAA